jgi:eukaryotic-like serine/threonine-protein kinase
MVDPGTVLDGGRYRLEERTHTGGLGEVWRASMAPVGWKVAVKILPAWYLEQPGFAERFRDAVRALGRVTHPGVASPIDLGRDESIGPYLVMKYVDGDSLALVLGRVGRLTPDRTLAILAQTADALQAIHEQGLVHRNVKPHNVLLWPDDTVVLAGCDVARAAGADNLTPAGSVIGDGTYITPEEALGEPVTSQTDIYALGVVAYECLSGRRPFDGDNHIEAAMRHVRRAPPPLPADVPEGVCAMVDRALAKAPADRWPSAAAFAQAARQASEGCG